MNEFLSATEVGKLVGVSGKTITRYADAGIIKCVRTVGRHRRFEKKEVERFLKKMQKAS